MKIRYLRTVVPRQLSDWMAVSIIVVVSCITTVLRAIRDDWLLNYDTFGYFLPYFGYLGDRLHQLELPAWNPYSFSGSPMIGDPASGWMYLPVMITFGLFTTIFAFKVLMLLLAIIGGIALYFFGRSIGFSPISALFMSLAFAIGPIIYGMASDGIAITMTYPTIAVGLLATERALGARSVSGFLGWSSLAGIGLTHNFASWPTNGLLYVGMYLAGWIVYRTFIDPHRDSTGLPARVRRALAFGLTASAFALGFGGAVIWPILDFTSQSPIAGADYSGIEGFAQSPSLPILNVLAFPLLDHAAYGVWTPGGAVVILAMTALILGRNRLGVIYFAVSTWIFIDLSANETLLRPLFNLVPMFELIHDHRPATISTMMYPAVLLLAGAGMEAYSREKSAYRRLTAVLISIAVFIGFVEICNRNDLPLGDWAVGIAYATAVLLLIPAALSVPALSHSFELPLLRVVQSALVASLLVYPVGIANLAVFWGFNSLSGTDGEAPAYGAMPDSISDTVDANFVLDTTFGETDPGSAAEFLQRQRNLQQPFRYASYWGADTLITERGSPEYVASLAFSRSPSLQLENISGYNPITLSVYGEYIEFMNGKSQDYHFADVYWPAFTSPQLLSMLNVRYVVVTTDLSFTPPIAVYGKEVYRDDLVIVYENPYALPRAWMVHDVRQLDINTDMALLASYQINAEFTALVTGDLPFVSPLPSGSMPDSVFVRSLEPESISMHVTTAANGMLVVSEIYSNGWNAYVDGKKTGVIRANYALRGVAVSAGEHEVILKYEPLSLVFGLWSTGVTSVAMIGVWSWAAVDRRRRSEAGSDCTDDDGRR